MATNSTEIVQPGRLSVAAQKNVITFAAKVMEVHKGFTTLQDKMDAIDVAYARYKESQRQGLIVDGVDIRRDADLSCNVFADDDEVTPPVVVSQVDTHVAYLTDVFLSGSPIFPVVSTPANKKEAEQLETLLDDHASIGGYVRQLLLFIRDAVKYNYAGVECDWSEIEQFLVADSFANAQGKKIEKSAKKFTRLKRINPRNLVRDTSVLPGDVSEQGDYVGYVERVSRMKLKRELNALTADRAIYNADRAMSSGSIYYGENMANCYREDPQISSYITANQDRKGMVDWDSWLDNSGGKRMQSYGTQYERFVLYARIMPGEFGISAPGPNTPQIWKFVIINGNVMISAKRIISAYDYLPILIGQPLEDGLGYQTQSVAEGEIPFQKAAGTLFNIKFAASRRAVSDRAIYDSSALNPAHVNSKAAAPKIPAFISALSSRKLSDLYYQIPFDMRGVENTIQDAQVILGFSKELHGVNSPRTGQFQKGNKSVVEWEDTMGSSDNRLRLPALVLEHQIFSPLRSILTLNIFQYGTDTIVVSQKTGEAITIDLDKLRKSVLAFRTGDGLTPKSKLASVPMITTGIQMISTSQVLQQQYGAYLPGMFAHLMSLGGVKGLEEYDPKFIEQQQASNPQQALAPQTPATAAPPPASALPNQSPPQGSLP